MSGVATAIVASAVIGGVVSSNSAKKGAAAQIKAAEAGAAATKTSAELGISEQRRQFDASKAILEPYVQAGYSAIGYTPQQTQSKMNSNFYGDGGAFEMMGEMPMGSGSIHREKPSAPSSMGGKFGGFESIMGTGQPQTSQPSASRMPSLQTFAGGYDQSRPALSSIMNAGTGAIPQLQQYAEGGANAFQMQQDLSGASGPEAQQAAYDQVGNEPAVMEMIRQGEQGILSNASATGNLRGGNTQGALAQFRPGILSSAIQNKYNQLGGMSQMGGNISQYLAGAGGNVAQNLYGAGQDAVTNLANIGQSSAAGQASAGLATGQGIASTLQAQGASQANLMGKVGAAQAGQSIAQGQAIQQGVNGLASAFGTYMGRRPSTPPPQYGQYGTGQGMMRNTGF